MAAVIADALHHLTRPVDITIHLYDPDHPERFNPLVFAVEFAKHTSQWQAVPDLPDKRSSDKQVFISYSHKDVEWRERLQVMLTPFARSFTIWDDTQIAVGEQWRKDIQDALASAKIAVLLVSPDFLASHFINEHELPVILAAAKKKGLRIFWVYLRPCGYKETEIGAYQAAHDTSHPLSALSVTDSEDQLLEICRRITAAMNA